MDEMALREAHSMNWQSRAACRNLPASVRANWFPSVGMAADKATLTALSICKLCPVQQQCLTYALANDLHGDRGIYGGLTAKQRRKLVGEMRAAGKPVDVRICVECRGFYVAPHNAHRLVALCSDDCRRARKRTWDRLHRPSGYARLKARFHA
jgi:hypothetical protein